MKIYMNQIFRMNYSQNLEHLESQGRHSVGQLHTMACLFLVNSRCYFSERERERVRTEPTRLLSNTYLVVQAESLSRYVTTAAETLVLKRHYCYYCCCCFVHFSSFCFVYIILHHKMLYIVMYRAVWSFSKSSALTKSPVIV